MKKKEKNKLANISKQQASSKALTAKSSINSQNNWISYLPIVGLLFIILFAFYPVFDNDLSNWDDPTYLNNNPLITSLDWANIKRIFTENYFGNYQPLHILSYAIEYHFYKLNPAGYHATSVFMFVLACLLVYFFLLLLSKNRMIAFWSTAFYGLNAMRVESVAWAAERKDLLYLIFFVASLITYTHYIVKSEKYKYLFFTFLFFTLSIFSKVMAASLIGPMIMLDYYYGRKLSIKLFLEKIPFVLLSVWVGLKQVAATVETGTIDTSDVFSLSDKLLIACRNLIFYPIKLIVPLKLSAFYPYPPKTVDSSLSPVFYLCGLLILIITALIIYSTKKTKFFLFTSGFFVSTIALVLQIMAVGPTMSSERYTLVPGIIFAFFMAYGLNYLFEKYKISKVISNAILSIYCLFLFVTTYQRCDVWQNSLTLWDDVIEQFPNVATALNNRGKYYGEYLQNYDKSMVDLSRAIQADPSYEIAYNNRGIVYSIGKQYDKAIEDFDNAIKIKPSYFEAIQNRAIAFASSGQFEKAIVDFTKSIEANPNEPSIYVSRGYTYLQINKPSEGKIDFDKAISLNPNEGNIYVNRSQANYMLQQFKAAESDLQKAIQLGAQVSPEFKEQVERANSK